MQYHTHNTILENGLVFTFVTNGQQRWLFSSKTWSQVSKQEIFELCDKLGADFDCFYGTNGEERLKAEDVKRGQYVSCLKNLATADDIFDDLNDESWWRVVKVDRPGDIENCEYMFRG